MYMSEEWIKLYRKIQDCPFWYDDRFSRGQAWVDILLLANHKDKKMLFNGQMLLVKRGNFLTSTVKLAERWHWNRKTVSSFLNSLEKEQMITKKTDNKKTVIFVINYAFYQGTFVETGQQSGQENGQLNKQQNGQQMDSRTDTNNNVKNDKNDNSVKKVNSVFKLPKVIFPEDEKMNEAFMEFAEMRARIKKPISTEKTFKRLLSTLEKLSNGDNNLAIEILNQSTDCCYQGLFEIKQDHRGNRNNNEVTMKDWMNGWGLESDGE